MAPFHEGTKNLQKLLIHCHCWETQFDYIIIIINDKRLMTQKRCHLASSQERQMVGDHRQIKQVCRSALVHWKMERYKKEHKEGKSKVSYASTANQALVSGREIKIVCILITAVCIK